jgi:hypothetical protein
MSTRVKWAALLCKCQNQADNPAAMQFFVNFFTKGLNGAVDYWAETSFLELDLRDSAVFGWLELPVTSTQMLSTTRTNAIQLGIKAARDSGIRIDDFGPKLVFINEPTVGSLVTIGGEAGPGSSGGNVLIAQNVLRGSFILHEMGHGHGLSHSRFMNGDHYGSPYCLMSAEIYGNTDPRYNDERFGPNGPGLCSPYAHKAGWLPELNDIWIYEHRTGASCCS